MGSVKLPVLTVCQKHSELLAIHTHISTRPEPVPAMNTPSLFNCIASCTLPKYPSTTPDYILSTHCSNKCICIHVSIHSHNSTTFHSSPILYPTQSFPSYHQPLLTLDTYKQKPTPPPQCITPYTVWHIPLQRPSVYYTISSLPTHTVPSTNTILKHNYIHLSTPNTNYSTLLDKSLSLCVSPAMYKQSHKLLPWLILILHNFSNFLHDYPT